VNPFSQTNEVPKDGEYTIQPSSKLHPINVTCSFTETYGITTITHNHPNPIKTATLSNRDGCDAPG